MAKGRQIDDLELSTHQTARLVPLLTAEEYVHYSNPEQLHFHTAAIPLSALVVLGRPPQATVNLQFSFALLFTKHGPTPHLELEF